MANRIIKSLPDFINENLKSVDESAFTKALKHYTGKEAEPESEITEPEIEDQPNTQIIKHEPSQEGLSMWQSGEPVQIDRNFVEEYQSIQPEDRGVIRPRGFGYEDWVYAIIAQDNGWRSGNGHDYTLPNGVKLTPSVYDTQVWNGKTFSIDTPTNMQGSNPHNKWLLNEAETVIGTKSIDPNIPDVDYDELLKIVDQIIYYPKSETSLMIWGAPGIGKTSIVKQAQKQYGGRMIDVQLTTYAPEDFFLPMIDMAEQSGESAQRKTSMKNRAIRVPQTWLPVYHEDEGEEGNRRANGPDGAGGIIFLDELSRASGPIRAVSLKLVNERQLDGGWKIGSKWVVIAASNRKDDDPTNTEKFGSALGNRFQQVNYSPSVHTVTKYFRDAKHPDTGETFFDPKLIDFLIFNDTQETKVLHRYIGGSSKSSSTAFPTPRTWESGMVTWKNLEDLLKRKENRSPSIKEIADAVSRHVGNHAAEELATYLRYESRIDFKKLHLAWTNPNEAPLPPKQEGGTNWDLTGVQICLSSIAYARAYDVLQANNQDKTNIIDEPGNIIRYMVRLDDPTHAATLLQMIWNGHPEIKDSRSATNWFAKDTGASISQKELWENHAIPDGRWAEVIAKNQGKRPPSKYIKEVVAPALGFRLTQAAIPAAASFWPAWKNILLVKYPYLKADPNLAEISKEGEEGDALNAIDAKA